MMNFLTIAVCFILLPLPSNCWWDLKTLQKQRNREARDTETEYNDWRLWPNASRIYSNETCVSELAPYTEVPKIVTDPGKVYDVKSLNTFKKIGESFLKLVTRKSLFETVQLTMELSPLNSVDKILQIVEYQLSMVILIVFGVFTATTILVAYVIFWSLKLTGNIKEVECQSIADSEGSMRFILTFLLCLFTVFVLFGCIIAWVANTHISNNVNEASNHIQWTVTVTQNFTNSIEEQMDVMFMKNYKKVQLGILKKRLDEAVTNASAVVYLEIAQNVSDMYNKSLMLAKSIIDHQKKDLIALKSLIETHNETMFTYLTEIKAAKDCISTISRWCEASSNSGKCNSNKEIPPSYLKSVETEELYFEQVISATADVINFSDNGALGATSRSAYFNGKFFHNGSLESKDITFYDDNPTYTGNCHWTDLTTGALLLTQGPTTPPAATTEHTNPENSILENPITCTKTEGCRVVDTATVLFWGECCVSIQYILDQSDPKVNNSDYTKCGPKEVYVDGKLQPGYQSVYRGNISTTVMGTTCRTWASVTTAGTTWDKWAASQGYTGLYYLDDPEDISFQHNFCRNPSPQNGLYGVTDEADVKHRAWCYTGDNVKDWEYCNVPYCASDTAKALKLAAADGTHAFHYPTCRVFEESFYGAHTPTATDFTMWITSEDARKEAYFALDEAAEEMTSQFEVIEERFNETNTAFDELQKTILNTISSGSEASKFDAYRNIGTIVIVCFCMMSACLAVAGVCMGYCNISDAPPHLRTSACSMGGRLIKISSYWAAMMAMINLYMATIFFVPGSIFSLICKDYYQEDLFKLFDDKVIVDYSILGRAVLDNGSYNMTFKNLWLSCRDNETIWVALGLSNDPDYDLMNMMQLNESLDVNYTFTRLLDATSTNFANFPAYPDKLKTWLTFWNESNATVIPWTTLQSNLKNSFLAVSLSQIDPRSRSSNKIEIDGKDFCDAFAPYGEQVTDLIGETFECRELFVDSLKGQCTKWVRDYNTMGTAINNLRAKVDLIEAQTSKYGQTYVDNLMLQYEYTNNNLLNKGGSTFSYSLINQTYAYWQPLMSNELNCLTWQMNYTMQNDLCVCYPVAKILDNTMDYFCGYMVTSMTLAWMSQGLLGLVLALHMLVANSLATYFLKLEKRHPDDIPKEDLIEGFQ